VAFLTQNAITLINLRRKIETELEETRNRKLQSANIGGNVHPVTAHMIPEGK